MPASNSVIAGAVGAALGVAILVSPPLSAGFDSADALILALDDAIQERFKDIDQAFGFRRIVKPNQTPHRFEPENARELTVVGDLERARLEVVLYVAGRRVLRAKPAPAHEPAPRPYGPIKGPVRVTYVDSASTSAPMAEDLWDEAVNAMLAFRLKDSHGFAIADWKFAARPVRASDAACLTCHTERSTSTVPVGGAGNALKLGDALGTVIYGFRTRSAGEADRRN